MKSILLTFLGLACSFASQAQQFSFQMVFVDAAGNRDSVTLGYDNAGSNGIDAAFGEQNIIATPYNSGLNVRASNIWWTEYAKSQSFLQGSDPHVDAFLGKTPMQTKKQVVKHTGHCYVGGVWKGPFNKEVPIIELDIKTDHWPVTAYWNSALFKDSCRSGSVITGMHPGAWWDHFTSLKAELAEDDSATFMRNKYTYPVNGGPETMPVYWLAFGDSSLTFDDLEMEWLLKVKDMEQGASVRVYPNPATNEIQVEINPAFGTLRNLTVYNLLGQTLLSQKDTKIDISSLNPGVYILTLTNDNGQKITSRFLKQ